MPAHTLLAQLIGAGADAHMVALHRARYLREAGALHSAAHELQTLVAALEQVADDPLGPAKMVRSAFCKDAALTSDCCNAGVGRSARRVRPA